MKNFPNTEQIKATLAVLTWKSPKTLAACLASIEPLFDFFDERLIVCQEGDPQELKIAESFGMRVIAPEENLGIQGGIKKCFEAARNELVFFCENDLQLRVPKEEAVKIMQFSAEYMDSSEAQCTFLRYRPESADRRIHDFNKYWRIKDGRVTKKLRAYLRPSVASFSLGKAVYFIHKDALDCANFQAIKPGFLLTDSSCIPHENLALFAKKSYVNQLIEFAEANPTNRKVNGSPDLEHPINSRKNRHWFIDNKFKILISCPGVFGHRRYDRHADDEKWNMVNPLDEGGEVVISQAAEK